MLSLMFVAFLMASLGYATIHEEQNTVLSPQSFLNVTGFEFLRSEVKIFQGKSDKRSYHFLTLKNGLPILLISDPHTTRAAASMSVGSGYFNDPKEFPGLSHFLEHMLFLGSKKYPVEGQYAACLARHSGKQNAYTSKELTTFFLSVNAHSLFKCIDRFAEFFVAPKLSQDSIGREMNAVNSEYSKNLQTDSWRMQAMKEHLTRVDSPYHKFGTGSIGTLKDVKHKDLYNFWSEHYHAGNMRLVVLGREPLYIMERKIRPIFSKIPKSPSQIKTIHTTYTQQTSSSSSVTTVITKKFIRQQPSIAFRKFKKTSDMADDVPLVYLDDVIGSVVHFQTVKDIKPLILSWTLPPQNHHYHQKSVKYLSSLLANGGEKSLVSTLKKNGWITSLDAGPDSVSNRFEQFELHFELTDDGVKHSNDIINMVFQNVDLIKKHGVQKWRYDELKAINMLAFDYMGKADPIKYVKRLSRSLLNVAPEDILVSDYMYEKYDPKHIHSILDLLTPDRLMILLGGKHQKIKYDQIEPWFGIKYTIQKIPDGVEKSFKNLNSHVLLSLPKRNIFVPKDLSIKKPNSLQNDDKLLLMNGATPMIVHEQIKPSARVWFRQDNTFLLPHGILNAKFWSGMVHANVRNAALSMLYSRLFEKSLEVFMDAPLAVGYSCHVTPTSSGIEVHLSGYNDKMATFSEEIFKRMGKASFLQISEANKKQFEVVKQTVLADLINKQFQKPHRYVLKLAKSLLHRSDYHPNTLGKYLKSIELKDVSTFEKQLRADIQLELFLHGNFLPKEAIQMSNIILKNYPFKTQVTSFAKHQSREGHQGVHRTRLARIPKGFTEVVTSHPNLQEQNNVVYTMFQLGEGSIEDIIYGTILGRVLKPEIYNNLRTKQQLGYVVWSKDSVDQVSAKNVNSLFMVVLSNHKNTVELQNRMLGVVPHLHEYIKKITRPLANGKENPKFLRFKESYKRHLEKNFTDISHQNKHMWAQIASSSLDFNRNAILRSYMSKNEITGKGLRKFFERYMKSRTLSLQVRGHAKRYRSLIQEISNGNDDSVKAMFRTCPSKFPANMHYLIEREHHHPVSVMSEANFKKWSKKILVPIEQLNQRFIGDLSLFSLPPMKNPPNPITI